MQYSKRYLVCLVLFYLIFCGVCSITPVDRVTWWAENITVWIFIALFSWLYVRKVRFSNVTYTLMTFFFCLHTIGGYYTFSEVPFGWVTDLIGAERNHFDRFAHFCVGFFALTIFEWVWQKGLTTSRFFASLVGWLGVAAFAGIFEVAEWLYAVFSDPEAGVAFLGSQGDVWDAQKDILADLLGATVTLILHAICVRRLEPPTQTVECAAIKK